MNADKVEENKSNTPLRYNNYDLLRVWSIIAVVMIHANWKYFGAVYSEPSLSFNWVIESILNILTRFSVPAFVMISGAFNNNEKNENPGYFYRKTVYKIFIPAIVIILILTVYNLVENRLLNISAVNTVRDLILGRLYNSWYIYMLAGLYLITPAIISIKKAVGQTTFSILTAVLMAWAIVSQATTQEKLPYSIGVCFAFAGYYIAGNVLKDKLDKHNRNLSKDRITILLLAICCIFCVIGTFIVRLKGFNYYTYAAFVTFFSPLTVIYSIILFYIFGLIQVNVKFNKIAQRTLEVYLFHTVVCEMIYRYLDKNNVADLTGILILTVGTLIISMGIAVAFSKTWDRLACGMQIKGRVDNLKFWHYLDN